jgi:hypothetical protein
MPLAKRAQKPKAPAKNVKPSGKTRSTNIAESGSESDEPLSKKAASRMKAKGKAVDVERIPLEKRFATMIKGDAPLYLRILQYEVCPSSQYHFIQS